MPVASPKPCIDCGALVSDGTTRCDLHKRPAWTKRDDAPKRRTGRWLQRERDRLFSYEPLCRECGRQGRVTLAVIRDHIVPLSEGGTDDDDNIQPLCQACSDVKTEAEKARGLARAGLSEPSPAAALPAPPGGHPIPGGGRPETVTEARFSDAGVSVGGVPR